jgi:hypothetical protein
MGFTGFLAGTVGSAAGLQKVFAHLLRRLFTLYAPILPLSDDAGTRCRTPGRIRAGQISGCREDLKFAQQKSQNHASEARPSWGLVPALQMAGPRLMQLVPQTRRM